MSIKRFIFVTGMLAVLVGNAQAVTVDEDVYNWTGWTSSTYDWGEGFIDSGYKTVLSPGENSTSATISGLTGDTDYVVWTRAWAKDGQTRAIRSVITANSGADKLGRYVTQETGMSSSGSWY